MPTATPVISPPRASPPGDVANPTEREPAATPTLVPIVLAIVQQSIKRRRRETRACTRPMISPATAPPMNAEMRLSTGPTIAVPR